jgi:hypothetical protein
MPRAVYGVDPEMLGLSGPNAFAQAFQSSLQGLQLGDRLASTALDRELARENARNIQQDRLTQATLGPEYSGGAEAPVRPSRGQDDPIGVSVPAGSFSAFLRPQLRADAALGDVNKTLAEYDAARAQYEQAGGDPPRAYVGSAAGTSGQLYNRQPREQGGFDPSGPENPLTRVGYVSDVLPTPDEAAMAVRRRAAEYGLSGPETAALVQDYENFYTQRMGQYQDSMAAMMQRQSAADAESQAQQAAAIQRGAEIANAIRFQGYKPTAEDLPYLGLFNRMETKAYEVPTGQAADTQQSRIAATPGTIRANTDRSVVERDSRLLAQMRKSIYETAYDNAIANGSTQEEADAIATRERDQVIDPASARQYFDPPSASDAPPLSESEVAYLLRAEDEAGGKPVKSDDEYAMRARAVMGNPSQLARLAAGKSATGTLLEKFMVDRFGVGQKQPVKPGEADQTLEL